MNPRQIVVVAGCNGAGKSSLAPVLLPKALHIEQFVNADLIAQGLSPFAPTSMALQAGRLMIRRIRDLLESRVSFGFETTLAGTRYAVLLRKAREAGYLVHLLYIWLRSPELALARIAKRVEQGGHDVPADTVVRRYYRGLKNFFSVYQGLADTWTLCDNSAGKIVVVAEGRRQGRLRVFNAERFERIQQSLNDANRKY
jgi:predicted ABC-type ATPase